MNRLELVIIGVNAFYMLFILELVRRRQLREKYAMLWLGVGIVGIVFAVWRSLLDKIAALVGIAYGPSLLFLMALLFLALLAAHLSWEVSRLEDKTRRLAEEIALMKAERAQATDQPTRMSN